MEISRKKDHDLKEIYELQYRGGIVSDKRLRQNDVILIIHRYTVAGVSAGRRWGSVVFTHGRRQGKLE